MMSINRLFWVTLTMVLVMYIGFSFGTLSVAAVSIRAITLIKRDNVTWKSKVIDGTIKLFIGLFSAWVGILLQNCGPGIIDAMGITNDTSVVDDMTNCAIAIGVSAAVAWAGLVIGSNGNNQVWVFDDRSSTAQKRDYAARLSNNRTMLHIGNDHHIDITDSHSGDALDHLSAYESQHHDNVFFTSNLYVGNSSYGLEHVGYVFAFNATDLVNIHVVVSDLDGIDGAAEAMTRFDGTNQTFDANAVTTNMSGTIANDALTKRGSPYAWASFTGWGGDTGYMRDLGAWGEYGLAARNMLSMNLGLVENTGGCTNDNRCYAVMSKWCWAIGFSYNQGDDDAQVGEIYLQSYGGLDYNCWLG